MGENTVPVKKSIFEKWHSIQYSRRQKLLSAILHILVFCIILPLILFLLLERMAWNTPISVFLAYPHNVMAFLPLLAVGLYLSIWSITVQFKMGDGTPAPVMPTQKLVVLAPYSYCRNPMGLGYGMVLWTYGLFFNSLTYVLVCTILFITMMSYHKFIEEKELEERFGQEYVEYKKNVPFLIPRVGRKRPDT